MERKQVILEDGKTVTSTAGRGMILGSNTTATTNAKSGYTLKKGTFDIADVANSTTAAYGVNGSKIKNEGTVKVVSSDSTNPDIW